ncbi:hypothetical protein [Sphaerisporangium sp. TRM90804]|uniref:hypothetical protein n=1 Tax=Sphaerisporangium sp. TRM90804 TaxID=3031113 RepID=UPI0024492076|nr:hypothetical protein [Sphaerisporangium sp. TRM90804]MDH2429357.1 hypothetical protein [Sphaerisporangium sp. TRM90804]
MITAQVECPDPLVDGDPREWRSCGVIVVARQSVSLRRLRAGQVVTVHVSHSTLTIDLDEGPRTVQRTTDLPASGEDRTVF